MKRFNDIAFAKHLEAWVDELNDECLNRAWEILDACIKVHAKVDRQPKQSVRAASREAWYDLALAFEGEPATFTMIGMLSEFEAMCPEELQGEAFQRKFEEAIALGRGEASEVEEEVVLTDWSMLQGKVCAQAPFLRVIDGGRE